MSAGRRVARSVVTLGVAQVATMGLNLVLWAHLGQRLGPEQFGVVGFGLALLSYFILAVTLGFDAVGIREVAREPAGERRLVRDVLGIRLTLGVVSTVAFCLVVAVVAPDRLARLALFVLGAQILSRAVQLDWVYQGRERMGLVAVRNAGAAAASVGLALALVRDPGDLVLAALALAAGPWLANLGLLGAYSREAGTPLPRADVAAWKALLVPALPLAASSFVNQIYYNVDKLMLAGLRSTVDVGLYEAGYKLFAIAVAPAAVLYPAFYPALSAAFGDAEAMRQRSRAFASALVAVGLPLSAGGAVLAPDLVDLVFGEAYAGAVPALRVLFSAAGVTYLGMAFGSPLMAWNRERDYMKAVFAGGAANLVLNAILIVPLGPVGAAAATLASELLVMAGMAWRFRRQTGTLYPTVLLRGLAAAGLGGVAPAAAAQALGWPVLASLAAVGVGTVVAAGAVRLVTPADVRAILRREPQ